VRKQEKMKKTGKFGHILKKMEFLGGI